MEDKIVKIYQLLAPACEWKIKRQIYDEIEKRQEDVQKLNQMDFHLEIQQYYLTSDKQCLKPSDPQQKEQGIIQYHFKIENLLPESQRIPATLQIINTYGIKIGKIKQSTTQGIVEIDHSQFGKNFNEKQKKYCFQFFLGCNVHKMKYQLSNIVEVEVDANVK